MKYFASLIIFLVSFGLFSATLPAPNGFSCEGATDPLVIGTQQPMLNWIPVNDQNGVFHESWQIQTASSVERLLSGRSDLWDSRWRRYETTDKIYKGKSLGSYDLSYWRVWTRTANGRVSAWSEPAFWRMGYCSLQTEPVPGMSFQKRLTRAFPPLTGACSDSHQTVPASTSG